MLTLKSRNISSSYPYTAAWAKARFKIREDMIELSDGNETTFYVVECPESVFIIPVTDSGKIVLVNLYRYRTQREGWEVPAGSVDQGEDSQTAALRELKEETGFYAKDLHELPFSFDSMNGVSNAIGHVFVAEGLSQSEENEQVQEGIVQTRAFEWGEILRMIETGNIVDGLSIAALMKYYVKNKQ